MAKEFTMDDVKDALQTIADDVKDTNDKARKEIEKYGKLTEDTKALADEQLMKYGELAAQMLDMQQKLARRGEEDIKPQLTAGHAVIESDEFKEFMAKGGIRMPNSSFVLSLPRAAITGTATTNTTTVGVSPDLQPGIIPGTQRRLTVRDLMTPGRTDSNAIQFVRETGFTNNAATVSETNLKPESTLTYELVQRPVVTIAHYFKASKQILDDFPQLQSNIDGRGRYGLKLAEETQLLKGSGVGNNLEGIYTVATAYAAPITVPSPTTIDTIRLMMLQAELAEYPSTGIVLHPSDWARIELKKDGEDRYLFANPQGTVGPRLWGLPVVATQAMTVDTALVGAFMLGSQIFDREDINVVIATMNEDDFIKNMITIRIEERLASAVYRTEAFVKNTNLPAS